ncbi:MAG: replicative DNA helicase, partial [Sphaerochaetaceae bacterium]|nr:replicative DNA helicase [Sphaerochaetaceae bacterium]
MADNIGRIPPHNNDAETALLGSILQRSKFFEEVANIISADDFYQRANQEIFKGIEGLRTDHPQTTVDIISLTNYLKEKGTLAECGGYGYIASLTSGVPNIGNATYYAEIIKTLSLKRKLYDLALLIGDKAFDETQDVRVNIDELESKLTEFNQNKDTTKYLPSRDFIIKVIEDIDDKRAGKRKSGLSTGFRTLDKMTGGFKNSDFIIIAARPSVGKTAFALSIAANMIFRYHYKVGFFSLEMSGQSLMERIISN